MLVALLFLGGTMEKAKAFDADEYGAAADTIIELGPIGEPLGVAMHVGYGLYSLPFGWG